MLILLRHMSSATLILSVSFLVFLCQSVFFLPVYLSIFSQFVARTKTRQVVFFVADLSCDTVFTYLSNVSLYLDVEPSAVYQIEEVWNGSEWHKTAKKTVPKQSENFEGMLCFSRDLQIFRCRNPKVSCIFPSLLQVQVGK